MRALSSVLLVHTTQSVFADELSAKGAPPHCNAHLSQVCVPARGASPQVPWEQLERLIAPQALPHSLLDVMQLLSATPEPNPNLPFA